MISCTYQRSFVNLKKPLAAIKKIRKSNPTISDVTYLTAYTLLKAFEPLNSVEVGSITTQKGVNILFINVETQFQSIQYEVDVQHVQWERCFEMASTKRSN
jgi:hypothetical protein